MNRALTVHHEFVEHMPGQLDEATLYVSIRFRTTAHLCLCGCGEKIVNPLRPHQWSLTFDGASVSLSPSVGNSGIPCKSHYWIASSKVRWLPAMTHEETAHALRRDGWSQPPRPEPTTATPERKPGRLRAWVRHLVRRRPRSHRRT